MYPRLRSVPIVNQAWTFFASLPPVQSEESLLLRVLVQLMVIIGIGATDIAGQTNLSAWAIPLSIIGATFSWYRRKEKNVAVKFLLALGMLLMMASFFGNLLRNLNDTRLVLAELLIQLQVLHSFDLPRRKDLGYSMVIGLILLGVAGTISQTLTFGLFLFAFLAIALPVLVLDYRSQLGLSTIDSWFKSPRANHPPLSQYRPLAPQRLALLLALTMVLGLGIFAVMPRFPGYQLQNMPVSSAGGGTEQQGFDGSNQGISNPGYVNPGSEGNDGGGNGGSGEEEGSPTSGPGQMDEEFYYGFNSVMNQNLRGSMEKKLLLRVRSQAPGFLRVMAFDRYTGEGWRQTKDAQIATIKRPPWSYRFLLNPPPTANTKEIIQTYTAVTDLTNGIPALSYPHQIFFPTREIGLDAEGGIRSPVPVNEGLTYTVISKVPYRDRAILGQAPQNYPQFIQDNYGGLPQELKQRIKAHTEYLLTKANSPLESPYEKALFLAQSIKQNYEIKDIPFFEANEDLVEAFLFKYQGGYGDHFATVLAVMLRSIDIPARLAVGFLTNEFNPFTGYYLIHNTDAYAVTEVYFPGHGWFSFDPIPGHELIPPSFEQNQTFGLIGQFWQWIAGWLPSPVTNFLSQLAGEMLGLIARLLSGLWQFFSGSLLGLLSGLVTLIGLAFIGWLTFLQSRKWLLRRQFNRLHPLEKNYQYLLLLLQEQGYPKNPTQTPGEYLRSIEAFFPRGKMVLIYDCVKNYETWKFSDRLPDLKATDHDFKLLEKTLKANKLSNTLVVQKTL